MPRISTDNYDTVASWNGSQDLFVVEQPDGTKVATPAMVKQFMEAGDFEATGEVKDGHGNILADMAKADDVDAEIGDLSQTGLTGDSVADQLADLNNVTKVDLTPAVGSNYTSYGNSYVEKLNKLVHLHIGISGITPNTSINAVFTLPAKYRPATIICAIGQGGQAWGNIAIINVQSNGDVKVYSQDSYALADVYWLTN